MTKYQDEPADRFAAFLGERESDPSLEIDAYCARFPEIAGALRELWNDERRRADRTTLGTLYGLRPSQADPLPGRPALEPGMQVDGFELVKPLGRGAMGEVWQARQPTLDRDVALKFILPERVSTSTIELFAREARASGRLHHPGLVTVYAHGESEGLAWIALELVEGAWSLADSLDELRRSDELPSGYYELAARFMASTADGLGAAHEAGVIHRDIKPANILLNRKDEPKVTDFGLAKLIDEPGLSATGDFVGTYAYMSPEQAASGRVALDHRTDVFSLGVVMYEMLTLRRPFEGDTSAQIAEKILTHDPPSMRSIRSGIPKDLSVICSKALEKRRDQRYASMAELGDDLRRFLDHEPVLAREAGPGRRAARWVRRNRVPTAIAAVVATVFGIVAASSQYVANAERRERLVVERSLDEQRLRTQLDLDELGPIHPRSIPEFESWLGTSRALVAKIDEYEEALAEFERNHADAPRAAARPPAEPLVLGRIAGIQNRRDQFATEIPEWYEKEIGAAVEAGDDALVARREAGLAVVEAEVPKLDEFLERQRAALPPDRTEPFLDEELEREHERRRELVRSLRRLAHPEHGAIVELERRLSLARDLGERVESTDDARWAEAIRAIADPEVSPLYKGLELPRQIGLVPLRQDPRSGLWEFWHVLSGAEPTWSSASNSWSIGAEDGVVLVLVPGGTFPIGASSDPESRNFVSGGVKVSSSEGPVHPVPLPAYFLSKYELTQGQWWRMAGSLPSQHLPGASYKRTPTITRTHPVESVSWEDCRRVLELYGLEIPTDARWERAARAGTESPFWSGQSVAGVLDDVNFADKTYHTLGPVRVDPNLPDDGFSVHAPVDAMGPSPWGFHAVFGNVAEWAYDWHGNSYVIRDIDPETGEHRGLLEDSARFSTAHKSVRGAGFRARPADLRVSRRYGRPPHSWSEDLGVRPARSVER